MNGSYATLNWVFYAALTLVAARAWCRCRLHRSASKSPVALFVGVLSTAVALAALRIAYVAPLAIIQDIVAARQILAGEPVPTLDITPLVKQVMAGEQRPSSLELSWPRLAALCPGLVQQEQEEYDKAAALIVVQAHPPLATMLVIPFVHFWGVHGTSLAISLLSIGCLGVTLQLVYRGLELKLSTGQKVLFWSVFLGWYPMFWVVRSGQWGAVLSLLVVAGWYNVRRDRPILAGFAIGLAASLKVYPALLIVYFLVRDRRAFVSAVASIVILNFAAAAILGVQSYVDYAHTARFVAGNYGHTLANWSLWSALYLVSSILNFPVIASRSAFLAIALALVAAISWLALLDRRPGLRTDVQYSLFVVAMTLLSPTCWSHYFVVLLLPLAVLANQTLRTRASSLLLISLFLVLAVPDAYTKDVISPVQDYFGPQAGMALLLLPTLALLGLIIWLSIQAWHATSVSNEFVVPGPEGPSGKQRLQENENTSTADESSGFQQGQE